jgi:hypothetical protein
MARYTNRPISMPMNQVYCTAVFIPGPPVHSTGTMATAAATPVAMIAAGW